MLELSGETIAAAAGWLRAQIAARGADSERFTLVRHYAIPSHPVDAGAAFDASNRAAFEQLACWYGGADEVLESVRAAHDGSEVRCWPHHFDIATLLGHGGATALGVGLEPGDEYYDEPYYYVSLTPRPSAAPAAVLDGGGSWHTRDWFGAVLPGSRVRVSADAQRKQIRAFIESAISIHAAAVVS